MPNLVSHQKNSKDSQRLRLTRSSGRRSLKSSPDAHRNQAARLLSNREVEAALSELRGWCQQGNKLHRQYHFSCFEKALGFLSGLALVAKAAEHPLEETEIYDSVIVDLTTPELGGIADVDVALAQKADELAAILNRLPAEVREQGTGNREQQAE